MSELERTGLAIALRQSDRGEYLISDKQIASMPIGGLRAFEKAALEFAISNGFQIRSEDKPDGLLFQWRKVTRVSQQETPTDNA
ncbi:hypothetical protein DEI97_013430 [Curtobacterium sp. MCLR17_032]|uniref:hypothetical protein n=1 Tax=Curtobacterium sp. MCLR17_032 TaxID=2175650 RepID=UPI000DA7F172|nr:hypothetical protein [Curtobacterium sp. MCLR17_032]WIE60742.1 hypothetical protein DEI97_013430 [Curtobacterium sp. MCLR17_032]